MTKPRSLERGFYLGQTDKLAQHRETVRCASRASEHRAGRPSFGPFFWCQKKYQKAPGAVAQERDIAGTVWPNQSC